MGMAAIFELRNLTKKFGGLLAVDDVSFSVKEGEILGLIGPNGAGKTTVLNCISALSPATTGKIFFRDQEITHLRNFEVARLGVGRTFQVVKPFDGMLVSENVAIGAMFGMKRDGRSRHTIRHQVEKILEFTDLTQQRNVYVTELTIAHRKRLEVARALAMEPKLLLLDEVMAGLTPTEVEKAMELTLAIRKLGITVLMIEHVMKAIMGISDRVVVLREGKVIAIGTPKQVSEDREVIKAYLGDRWADKRSATV
jgi:branched-chain amino acid transport system ATP-binding protein